MTNYYATVRGTLASATLQEMFLHTFAIISSADQDTVANALATEWQELLNTAPDGGLKTLFPPPVIYNEVTVARIINQEPPDPRIAAASHVQFDPIPGTAVPGMLPSQCSLAVSITAGSRPNGVPAKGRFHLPGPAAANVDANDGTLLPVVRDRTRDQMANWWASMNQLGHRPALWSRTYGTVVGWDNMRVGNKIDTIRRRRNELPEAYSVAIAVP